MFKKEKVLNNCQIKKLFKQVCIYCGAKLKVQLVIVLTTSFSVSLNHTTV